MMTELWKKLNCYECLWRDEKLMRSGYKKAVNLPADISLEKEFPWL